MILAQIQDRRDEILRIAATHGARNVRIIGSVARGEDDESSDIDFLVEFDSGRSLFDLSSLRIALQDALGRPVDVATPGGLREGVRERVLKDAREL